MSKYVRATSMDEELTVVMKYIVDGWPTNKKLCAARALGYWALRSDLSIVGGVVFYGSRLVVPVSLRNEVIDSLHSAHQGITKTLQRASGAVFWPGLKRRIEDKCLACEPCRQREINEKKEPMLPMPVPQYPFQVIGIDLFTFENEEYLMVVDYLSKWPIVKQLSQGTTSMKIIGVLKEVFSDFGLPERIISDNGPQLVSTEFHRFCRERKIEHSTSSPLHPSANGQVERTIGTVKAMMDRCNKEGADWRYGLTSIRNTPVADKMLSPAAILQGRTLRDRIPVDQNQYKVAGYDLESVRGQLSARQSIDKYYHDAHSGRDKAPLEVGQQCYFKAARGNWLQGCVTKLDSDRSYLIKAEHGHTFRRNRKDMRPSRVEKRQIGASEGLMTVPNIMQNRRSEQVVGGHDRDGAAGGPAELVVAGGETCESGGVVLPRRSGRVTRRPVRFNDYIMGQD
jgi:hypothetical protein